MPTQVISKSSTQAMERRISSKQAKIAKLRKEKAKIFKQMKLEAQKEETLKTFYEKYTANSKAEIALFGQELSPDQIMQFPLLNLLCISHKMF